MLLRQARGRRQGAAMVESAIVLLLTLLLVLGAVVIGLGIFRYQQLASLAREAARYASVRGGQYQKDTGQAAATPQSIYGNVIAAQAVGLDLTQLQSNFQVSWDDGAKMPTYFDYKNNVWKSNNVTVTVTYTWIPEAFLGGVTLSSTSVMPLSY
jgi:Flp pilus assembly protein TadG